MTRRAFLEKYLLKFAVALAMLGLIVYTVGHSLGMRAGELLTTPVHRVTDRQITKGMAYIFRDEAILTSEAPALFDVLVASGSKVGKNVALAQAHTAPIAEEESESAQRKLDELNRAIRILEGSRPEAGESLASAEDVRAEAVADYMQICAAVQSGDLGGIASLEDAFLRDMNRYLILSGKTEDADAILESLRAEEAKLLEDSIYTTISNTASSGVFYSADYVDGYESLFGIKAAKALTEKSFRALREQEPQKLPSDRTLGKMVYGYSWYVAIELPTELVKQLKAGESYAVSFPENNGRTLDLKLERTDGSLALFRSDDTPTGFAYYRAQAAEITLEEREGLYIPDAALRTEGGFDGVYIFENSTAYFRKIKILYRGDGYCIASDESDLLENDILITSGNNLYDGKVYE